MARRRTRYRPFSRRRLENHLIYRLVPWPIRWVLGVICGVVVGELDSFRGRDGCVLGGFPPQVG